MKLICSISYLTTFKRILTSGIVDGLTHAPRWHQVLYCLRRSEVDRRVHPRRVVGGITHLILAQDRLQRRLHSEVLQSFPVKANTCKKVMAFNLLPTFCSQPFLGVKFQQRVNEPLEFQTQALIFPDPIGLCILNQFLDLGLVLDICSSKGGCKVGHFVAVNSQGPEIYLSVVLMAEHHFRSIVDRSSCQRLCKFVLFEFSCQSEVCQFDVAIKKKQQIFRFEIPIDNIFGVQVLESQDEASQYESQSNLVDIFEHFDPGGILFDEGVGVSSFSPFHYDVKVVVIFEGKEQFCYKIAAGFLQDLLLETDAFCQSFLHNICFLHSLYCVSLHYALSSVGVQLSQENLSETTGAYEV